MNIQEQLLSFLFCIFYGIIIFLTYNKIKKYLYNYNKTYNFFNSVLYCLILTLLFYKILYFINDGVINIYFILITILSYIFFCKVFTKFMSK